MAEHIVIVGAGQAGAQAVASLRKEGFSGALSLIGAEPFPPYQRPPLSKAYLAGTFARERLFLKPSAFFEESECRLQLGTEVTRIDRQARQIEFRDANKLGYDRLLLATGARVRRLATPGAELPGLYYLRGIEDVDALRPQFSSGARLVVVGGGYIGLEVAAVAVSHGLEVTVIEAAGRVMERAVSKRVSDFYEDEHRAHGVRFLLDTPVQGFAGGARVEHVMTGTQRIAADFVLVGVGAVPNAELAEAAGLETDNGIVVDDCTRTSDPHIFAAGDCTNHPAFAAGGTPGRVRLESVQNAIDQAKHAALAMVGRPKPYREVPWFWSDQYDLKLQMAGLARPGDQQVLRGERAARKFAVFHLRDGRIAAVEAVNAAPEYVVGRRLIAEGKSVAPERLADSAVPMKSLI